VTLLPIAGGHRLSVPVSDAADELRGLAQTPSARDLDSPRYTALLLRCYSWLATGDWALPRGHDTRKAGRDFASAILHRRHRRLRSFGGKRADMSEAELHRLRLMAKKQRYVGEFFRELYPRKATGKYIAALPGFRMCWASQRRAGERTSGRRAGRFLADVPSLGSDGRSPGRWRILLAGQRASAEDMSKVSGVGRDFSSARPSGHARRHRLGCRDPAHHKALEPAAAWCDVGPNARPENRRREPAGRNFVASRVRARSPRPQSPGESLKPGYVQ